MQCGKGENRVDSFFCWLPIDIRKSRFAVAGEIPVWPCDGGNATGRPLEPIYPSAPRAAAADRRVYDNLAIFDMLRCGRLRERAFAAEKLREIL